MAALGLLRLWHPAVVFPALAAWTLFLLRGWRRPAAGERAAASAWTAFDRVLAALLALLAGFNLFAALMPEISHDALSTHLALPQLFWSRGGMAPTPLHAGAGGPMLAEMLYGLALPLGGEQLAHLVHWSFGATAAGMAFCLGRRLGGPRAGLLSALAFYSTPAVGILSWTSSTELGWALFQSAASAAVALAFTDRSRRSAWLRASGLFTGLAMATGYLAWPFLGVVLVVIAWRLSLEESLGGRDKANILGGVALIALAAAAVWPLRNAWFYGAPLFPLRSDRLVTDLAGWEGLRLSRLWTELVLPGSGADALGFLFALGAPLLAFVPWRVPAAHILLGFLGLGSSAWLACGGQARTFLPALLPAAVLYALAAERLPALVRRSLYVLLAAAACGSLLTSAAWFGRLEGLRVVLGQESVESYLSRPHPSYERPYHPAALFVRRSLPKTARILIVGDDRGYGLERDFAASPPSAGDPLVRYLKLGGPAGDLGDRLRAEGFTHLLINRAGLKAAAPLRLDPAESRRYHALQRSLKSVFEWEDDPLPGEAQSWCAVAAIEPPRPTSARPTPPARR
ncbi:MAG: hypothetical protein HY748_06665 [Elusimicrobia bacterium]|nr:hypothetical protein [Elusimicrobiota bacterium]